MRNEFIVGNTYYLKIDISKLNTTETFSIRFSSGKYRVDNGAWVTRTTYEYIYFSQSDIMFYWWGVPYNAITLSGHSTLEIYGTISQLNITSDNPNYKYLQSVAIREPYLIYTYNLKTESHMVDKSSKLTLVKDYYGVFREDVNILNPLITLELESIPTFNYVYIPSLSRYYFVTDINCVRRNVYMIQLKVDVLYTYGTDIRKQNCYVSRNANNSNNMLVDERRPMDNIPRISYTDVSSYRNVVNAVNVTIDQSDFSGKNFVVTNVASANPSMNVNPPTNAPLLPSIGCYASGLISYAIDLQTTGQIQSAFAKDDTKRGYNCSLIAYPFDITTFTTTIDLLTPISILFGDYVIKSADLTFVDVSDTHPHVEGLEIMSSSFGYAVVEDFKVYAPYSGEQSFLNYEPYLSMEMFIPFVGWVKVNPKDIWAERIIVYYGIDVLSGFATAYVYAYGSIKRLIYSAPCQIGVKLPIITSNQTELEREKQNNVSNLTLGLISSGLSLAVGGITQNPLAIVGGVLSVAQTIKSYTNANNLMFERGQATFTSTETAFYQHQNKVMLKYTYHAPLTIDEDVYKELNGYPINKYLDLSSVTGYTEIPDMHYIPDSQLNITKSEIDEIVSLARAGIIL